MKTSDLIIIGAGPGGYETAVQAAAKGKSVTIVEARHWGGTCLNEGCIPTKCLAHSAEMLQAMKHSAAELGISCGEIAFSLTDAVAHKDAVVAQLSAGVAALMKSPGITCVQGEAHFVDARVVAVGDEYYTAPHIVIATGSVAKRLPIEGAMLPNVVTSTELFNQKTLPQRLCIIGGGVIGLEFAGIFNACGTDVTVVEYCKEVLPNMDKDMAKRLRTVQKKQGVKFFTDSAVTKINPLDTGACEVHFETKGKASWAEADMVLMAVGRVPNLAPLHLEKAGVGHTDRGIQVDDNMQTSVEGIYAIGDVNGRCQLAHAATFQGRRALHHICGEQDDIDFSIIPAAVFTSPQLASVGWREEDFLAAKPVVHKAFYRANGRALTMGAQDGYMKILADESGRIRGVHILGEQASDLIHEAAALMNMGATVGQLSDMIHAHPTLSELYVSACH